MVSKTNSNFGIENSAENRQEVKDKLIQTFLQNAVNEVGYLESKGNINKYSREIHSGQGKAWCVTFINAMLNKTLEPNIAKQVLGLKGFVTGTESSRDAYMAMNAWHDAKSGYVPKPGDQIFYNLRHMKGRNVDHVGIVERVENGIIYTIEGNTSNSPVAGNPAKERDGEGVFRKERRLTSKDIVGYGTPNWEVAVDYTMKHGYHQEPENKQNNTQEAGKVEKLPHQESKQEPKNLTVKEQKHENPSNDSHGSIFGSKEERGLAIYSAFRKAGLSDAQARVMTAEVGRENSWDIDKMFGYHKDNENHKRNGGIISWQGDRRRNLERFLEEKGLIKDGIMVRSQEALDAQAKFLVSEMKNNLHGGSKKNNEAVSKFLSDPNIGLEEGRDLIGKNFIRWRIDDPAYREKGLRNFSDFAKILDKSLAHVPQNSSIAKPNPSERLQQEQNQKPEISSPSEKVKCTSHEHSKSQENNGGFFSANYGIEIGSFKAGINICFGSGVSREKLPDASLKTADAAKENNREQENNAENNQTYSSGIDMGK